MYLSMDVKASTNKTRQKSANLDHESPLMSSDNSGKSKDNLQDLN